MAKLAPKDPQFGIPIATRIPGELAFRFNNEAIAANKTLSRYVAEFINKASAHQEIINDLEVELFDEREWAETIEKNLNELRIQFRKEKEKSAAQDKLIKELETMLAREKVTVAFKEKRVKELESQITTEKATAQKTTSRFIIEVTKGHKEKATQLIQTYNNILQDERRNNS